SFSKGLEKEERVSASRKSRRERGLRDQEDYSRHMDYIHWNPVKHQWVNSVKDWPYSSFHNFVKQGFYPENWGSIMPLDIEGIE
ncbi:transposase, partial [Methylomonas sp. WSC-6]|nr:transposase [Methylomonas sp. WSC-6]